MSKFTGFPVLLVAVIPVIFPLLDVIAINLLKLLPVIRLNFLSVLLKVPLLSIAYPKSISDVSVPASLNPLPSGSVVPAKLWLCPAIFVPFGSVFSAFFPTVSLPPVVSGLGVLFSSSLGTRFRPEFLYPTNAL